MLEQNTGKVLVEITLDDGAFVFKECDTGSSKQPQHTELISMRKLKKWGKIFEAFYDMQNEMFKIYYNKSQLIKE